jgi:hypothetical protein
MVHQEAVSPTLNDQVTVDPVHTGPPIKRVISGRAEPGAVVAAGVAHGRKETGRDTAGDVSAWWQPRCAAAVRRVAQIDAVSHALVAARPRRARLPRGPARQWLPVPC